MVSHLRTVHEACLGPRAATGHWLWSRARFLVLFLLLGNVSLAQTLQASVCRHSLLGGSMFGACDEGTLSISCSLLPSCCPLALGALQIEIRCTSCCSGSLFRTRADGDGFGPAWGVDPWVRVGVAPETCWNRRHLGVGFFVGTSDLLFGPQSLSHSNPDLLQGMKTPNNLRPVGGSYSSSTHCPLVRLA